MDTATSSTIAIEKRKSKTPPNFMIRTVSIKSSSPLRHDGAVQNGGGKPTLP